jgi:hypothetical protein
MYEYLSVPRFMQYYGMEPFTEIKGIQSEIDWYSSFFWKRKGVKWAICKRKMGE